MPAVALKNHFDQRQALDEEQEMQLEVVRRKYNEKVKPFLDRVIVILDRQPNSSKAVRLRPKKCPH